MVKITEARYSFMHLDFIVTLEIDYTTGYYQITPGRGSNDLFDFKGHTLEGREEEDKDDTIKQKAILMLMKEALSFASNELKK